MYVINGIAYAGEQTPPISVVSIRALNDYKLFIRFNTGEEKIFDFIPLLDFHCYKPLKDLSLFNAVYVDYGVAVWNDGNIDIAPETLYKDGVSVEYNHQKVV